jgi:perosamine synthetase
LLVENHPVATADAKQPFDELDPILSGRRKCAESMMKQLSGMPGINLPIVRPGSEPSWYAFVFQYDSVKRGGLPIGKFYETVAADGCNQLDCPGAACLLNLPPLFQDPAELSPSYKGKVTYGIGDFLATEEIDQNALKLPVWHREEAFEIFVGDLSAIRKIASADRELL